MSHWPDPQSDPWNRLSHSSTCVWIGSWCCRGLNEVSDQSVFNLIEVNSSIYHAAEDQPIVSIGPDRLFIGTANRCTAMLTKCICTQTQFWLSAENSIYEDILYLIIQKLFFFFFFNNTDPTGSKWRHFHLFSAYFTPKKPCFKLVEDCRMDFKVKKCSIISWGIRVKVTFSLIKWKLPVHIWSRYLQKLLTSKMIGSIKYTIPAFLLPYTVDSLLQKKKTQKTFINIYAEV